LALFCLANNNQYQLSVREVVNAYRINKNSNGLEGYDLPKFDAHLDKAISYKVHNTKKKNYIDDAVKMKSFIPSPTIYEVAGSLLNPKKHSNLCKGIRMTLPLDIEKLSKKEQKPGPGAYEATKGPRLLGAFNLKSAKVTFIEDAKWVSM
jgi:hypothetical protein